MGGGVEPPNPPLWVRQCLHMSSILVLLILFEMRIGQICVAIVKLCVIGEW